ncbi:MAG: hypothetical protein QOE03_3469, partial [Micromonosporaceae bacterium]|nr:hypothetical protein [Micromonosporaceae bacterium]
MTSSARVPGPPGRHARRTSRGRAFWPLTIAAVVVPVVVLTVAVVPVTGRITARNRAAAAVPPPPPGMGLVFSDDFTGAANTGIDTANWLYDLGTSYPGGAPNFGTGEVETMTNSTTNVFQDGAGHLAIRPVRDAAGRWTSGRIETQRTDFAAPVGGKVR